MARDQDSPELGAAVRALVAPLAATEAGPVLLCLQKVQEHFGYVPDGAVAVIADVCNITRADVHGVFSYYSDLKESPGPAVPVRICAAEACQAVGARALAKAWREQCEGDPQLAQDTGVDEPVYCLGNCALGPAALVNGELVGRADVQALVGAVAAARSGESS